MYKKDITYVKGISQCDIFFLAGVVGFEPTKCRSQSPMPYHLATPQYMNILYNDKNMLSIKNELIGLILLIIFIGG